MNSKPILLITHPSSEWDKSWASLAKIRELAQNPDYRVIFLKPADREYIPEGLRYESVNSEAGAFSLPLNTTEIISAGGNFNVCHYETFQLIIKAAKGDMHITYPSRGIYIANGDDSISLEQRLSREKDIIRTFRDRINYAQRFPDYRFSLAENGQEVGSWGKGDKVITLNIARS